MIIIFNFYLPTRIHYGCGELKSLGHIVKKHGQRCLLVTTENAPPLRDLYDQVKRLLKEASIAVEHFDKAVPNPSIQIVEEGILALKAFDADVVLAVGGGSSIDTAKSIALLKDQVLDWPAIFNKYSSPFESYESISNMPLVSVPTTAGTGSEVTQAAVLTDGLDKNSIYHPDNYSNDAVLDPNLLLTLPNRLTASTGFDAFTHAFESYISVKASPMSQMYAMKAMVDIVEYLPKALKEPKNIDYREKLMLAQSLAGGALANAGANAPHPLSEIIGGICHISHGESLALVFPEFLSVYQDKFQAVFSELETIFHQPIESGVIDFLETINLYKTWDDYKVTSKDYEMVYQSPILKFLPFGDEETLKAVIELSKARKKRS